MKSRPLNSSRQSTIQLNIASRPLQFIAAISALIFVLNFALEILDSFGASFTHVLQVICLIGALSVWVLAESLLILRHHDWSPLGP